MKYEYAIDVLQDEIIFRKGQNITYSEDDRIPKDSAKLLISSNEKVIELLKQAQSLLNSENGVGVSDSSQKHGDLPHVRKRHVSDEADTISDESEQITLGKRIDSGNRCKYGDRLRCTKCGRHISNADYCEFSTSEKES